MLPFRRVVPLLALLAAFVLAACGDDESTPASSSSSGSNSSDTAPAGIEESAAAADEAFEVPTEIPVTDGLESAPEKKTAAFIEPQIPAGKSQTVGFQNAADAIGWDLKVIPSDPFKPAGAVQQAIDQKVDYIFITGAPTALFAEQLKKADKAGIGVFECYGTDRPEENPGLLAQCGDDTSAEADGALVADWVISDSEGKANVLSVNIPDYPILVAQEKGFMDRVEANCPDCSVDTLGVTVDDLAKGSVPQAVASKLQSNPDIDYIYYTMSDLPSGVYDTLAGAGLAEQAKAVGLDFNEARLQDIIDGKQSVAMGLPKEYSAWLLFHFAAQHAAGGEVTNERELANLPRILVGEDEASKYLDTRFQWPGPEGFEDQFKQLWKVG